MPANTMAQAVRPYNVGDSRKMFTHLRLGCKNVPHIRVVAIKYFTIMKYFKLPPPPPVIDVIFKTLQYIKGA